MSIILDALKKAEEGDKQKPQGQAPAAPGSSPTLPGSNVGMGLDEPSRNRASGADKKKVIVLGVALVLALGFLLFANSLKNFSPLSKLTSFLPGFNKSEPPGAEEVVIPIAPAVPTAVPGVDPALTATAPSATTTPLPSDLTAVTTPSSTPSSKAQLSPEAQQLKDQAGSAFSNGDYEDSASAYEKLLIVNSVDPELYNNYGVSLRKAGLLEKAMEAYNKALALQPDYPQGLNNMAVAYMADNKYVAAKDLLERAIQLDPEYIDPYLHLGICLEKNGELEAAKESYEMFLKLSEKKVDRKIRLQVEERLAALKDR